MSQTLKTIASWFSGTHEQLMQLLKTEKQTATNVQTTDLEAYTVTELKSLAKEKGLKGYSSLNKANLIKFINENS